MPPSLGPVGPGLEWGSPGQGRDPHKLPPMVESGVREMNPREQETREWRVEGEGIRASTRPYPRYLRPLAGSLDDSEPPRIAGTETRLRAGLQVLQGPRRSRLPALVSLCVSRRRHDLHKPRLPRACWALIGSAEAEWQAGFQVGTRWPVRPRYRSAPRPPAVTFPESQGKGEGCTFACILPRDSDPRPSSEVKSVHD